MFMQHAKKILNYIITIFHKELPYQGVASSCLDQSETNDLEYDYTLASVHLRKLAIKLNIVTCFSEKS